MILYKFWSYKVHIFSMISMWMKGSFILLGDESHTFCIAFHLSYHFCVQIWLIDEPMKEAFLKQIAAIITKVFSFN